MSDSSDEIRFVLRRVLLVEVSGKPQGGHRLPSGPREVISTFRRRMMDEERYGIGGGLGSGPTHLRGLYYEDDEEAVRAALVASGAVEEPHQTCPVCGERWDYVRPWEKPEVCAECAARA